MELFTVAEWSMLVVDTNLQAQHKITNTQHKVNGIKNAKMLLSYLRVR